MKNFMEILYKLNIISVSYADSIEDTPVNLNTTSNTSTSSVGSLLIFLFTFLVITAILIFIFMVINKKNKLEYLSNQNLKVVDRIKIDHNSHLYAIKVQDQIHIIGKTDGCITPISVISDIELVRQLELESSKNSEQSFQSIFNDQLNSICNTSTSFKNFKTSGNTTKAFKFNSKK